MFNNEYVEMKWISCSNHKFLVHWPGMDVRHGMKVPENLHTVLSYKGHKVIMIGRLLRNELKP